MVVERRRANHAPLDQEPRPVAPDTAAQMTAGAVRRWTTPALTGDDVLLLQRTIGNRALSTALPSPHLQRRVVSDIGPTGRSMTYAEVKAVLVRKNAWSDALAEDIRRLVDDPYTTHLLRDVLGRVGEDLDEGETVPLGITISGHGRLEERKLQKSGMGGQITFPVPANVIVHTYAPPGAWLENVIANEVEEGLEPQPDLLEIQHVSGKRQAMPTPYPKTYQPGEAIPNYMIGPPDFDVVGTPITFVKSLLLSDVFASDVVETEILNIQMADPTRPVDIHLACCTVGPVQGGKCRATPGVGTA